MLLKIRRDGGPQRRAAVHGVLRANLMMLPRTLDDGEADDEIRLLVIPQKTPQKKKILV